jgi:valyl-tRNA synthetase
MQTVVGMARTLRAESRLDPKQVLEGTLYSRNDALATARKHAPAIQDFAKVKLAFVDGAAPANAGAASAIRSTPEFDLVLQLPKSQEDAQRKRMEKEREQLVKNIDNSRRQLGDDVFLSKAPAKVVDTIRQKLADYEAQLQKIDGAL